MTLDSINAMMLGAITMASFVCGAFFLRFWTRGRDTFFLLFACSFFVEGLNRVAQALSESPSEGSITRYGVRMVAFALILEAIRRKNKEA
jgi:uncharacterized membrane protein HdeD (DUF308 family)